VNAAIHLSSEFTGSRLRIRSGDDAPDGRVFEVGANGKTAIYDPVSNLWSAGPPYLAVEFADDAPGAILPNGHFLFAADSVLFNSPTRLYEIRPGLEHDERRDPERHPR